MGIEILPVGADDSGAIDEWFALSSLIRRHLLPGTPPPSAVRSRARLRWPWPGVREFVWLARVDGRAAGLAEASLGYLDNLDNAKVEVQVHPDMRRHGLGRRLRP